MTTIYALVEIQPLDLGTAERVAVRVGMANLRTAPERDMLGLGGMVWEPALAKGPELAMAFFNGDFASPVRPGTAALPLRMEVLRESWPEADAYDWSGAPVTIFFGEAGESWPWETLFSGRVTGFSGEGDEKTLVAEVDTEPFDADQLPETYSGDNESGGGDDLKGRAKPLVIGWASNVEPVLINATDNVWQFSGYGPIEEVTVLYERASSFGSPVANYSSYANLVAATIANGKYATCLAEGMIRLGAPAAGLITGDIKGHAVGSATPRLTGAIIEALAEIAGVSAALIEPGTLDALDRAAPRNVNLVLAAQQGFLDTVKALALGCNRQAGIGLSGKLLVTAPDLAGPEHLTLDMQGRAEPLVLGDPKELDTSPPFAKTVMGANRNWRRQSPDEIAFTAEIVDKGAYNASVTYREGNYVTLPNGAKYLYISATPSAGHEPPNGTYWSLMSGGIDGVVTNIVYKKNATQPSTPGASSGVPSGWVDDYASLPGTDLPVWASFGTKASGATNYAWDTPYPMLADLRTYAASDSGGNANPGTVDTPAVVDEAINSSDYAESSTVINFSSGTKTTVLSFSKTITQSGSVLKVDAVIGFSASDAVDGYFYLEVLSGATIVRSRMNPLEIDCNGSSQLLQVNRAFFSGLSAGTYTVRVSFERFSSETCSTNGTYSLEATEQKK